MELNKFDLRFYDLSKSRLHEFSNLQVLKIRYCNIRTLPDNLARLKDLRYLYVGNNKLEHYYAKILAQLPKLRFADFTDDRPKYTILRDLSKEEEEILKHRRGTPGRGFLAIYRWVSDHYTY